MVQITEREFREELQNNPVLSAALAPPLGDGTLGEEAGEHALREIYRRWGARCSDDEKRRTPGVGPSDGKESSSTITWPEFVSVFIPLGQWEAEYWEGGKEMEEEGRVPSSLMGVVGGLGEGELQLLRVAFATVTGRGFEDGTVSLTELRVASAQLDGVETLEEPVRKALQVKGRSVLDKRAYPFLMLFVYGVGGVRVYVVFLYLLDRSTTKHSHGTQIRSSFALLCRRGR